MTGSANVKHSDTEEKVLSKAAGTFAAIMTGINKLQFWFLKLN